MSLYHTVHSSEYPKFKYAPTGGAVMVANKSEELALGPGWCDNGPTPAPIAESGDAAELPAGLALNSDPRGPEPVETEPEPEADTKRGKKGQK